MVLAGGGCLLIGGGGYLNLNIGIGVADRNVCPTNYARKCDRFCHLLNVHFLPVSFLRFGALTVMLFDVSELFDRNDSLT